MKPSLRQKLATQALQKAVRIRKRAGIPDVAPVNPVDTALHFECPIWYKDIPSLEGIYSSDPLAIILGSQRTAGRRSYTCAHEYGHHVFGHGTQVEQLNEYRANSEDVEIEYVADMFAGFFLMNETAVKCTLNQRKWDSRCMTPLQTFMLASYFGVSYSAIIHHLSRTMRLIPFDYSQDLLAIQPKEIKSRFNAIPGSDVVIADHHWKHRAADLEIGDTLVVPPSIKIISNDRLGEVLNTDKYTSVIAKAPGLAQAYDDNSDWAINVRISKKNYAGLAENRHLKDEEYEDVLH